MANLKDIDYFDHDADIGIIGRGRTVEEAFTAAARAVFSIMTDLNLVHTNHHIEIAFEETDEELALITWLNILLAKAKEQDLILSSFQLYRDGAKWMGIAFGDHWQPHYSRGTEVKGATLTMLKVLKNQACEVRCVVDV
jgi:SHS2 domain-containing protein